MKKSLKQLSILLLSFLLFSRTYANQDELEQLQEGEKALISLGYTILNGNTDSIKYAANAEFTGLMGQLLSLEASFLYPFDSLLSISKLRSENEKVRIYTWNMPKEDGSFSYYGYVQHKPKNIQDLHLRRK